MLDPVLPEAASIRMKTKSSLTIVPEEGGGNGASIGGWKITV
ncbi:MAG: hypothetical protein R2795_18565 [Saprospiraceae bacterium]